MNFLWTLANLRSPVLDAIFSFITLFGEETIAVCLLCALYWCLNKELAYSVSLTFFISALVIQGLKIALRIQRPWLLDPSFLPVEAALATATGYSFPSGHTQTAAAIFGTLGLATRKRGWIIASWGFVLLVGLSRMYLGVHTPADVFGAILITLLIGLGVLAYVRGKGSDTILLIVLGVLSAIVLTFAFVLYGQGVIESHYVADCLKAAGGCIGCALALFWARRKIPFSTSTPKVWQQAAKLVVGLAVLVAIKELPKMLLGSSLFLDAARYFFIALWALAIYPLLFAKVFPAKEALS